MCTDGPGQDSQILDSYAEVGLDSHGRDTGESEIADCRVDEESQSECRDQDEDASISIRLAIPVAELPICYHVLL